MTFFKTLFEMALSKASLQMAIFFFDLFSLLIPREMGEEMMWSEETPFKMAFSIKKTSFEMIFYDFTSLKSALVL